jgi:1-aminocyclopropane-1-carboxylate deaminase/D-cysteine desulfhydrase-like pyridoxal-dependent ACC family enzyme
VEGLVLNPIYTGRAFAALLADIANGSVQPGHTVVFMNTGGDPLVFAYAASLAAMRRGAPH